MSQHFPFSKALRHTLLGVCAGAMLTVPAAAQSSKQERLKAAIVFNVLRFVDFPDSGQGSIQFCVSANDPSVRSFTAFSGRVAGSRTVNVRTIRGSTYAGCDVVYLGSASKAAVARAKQRGRLVVGDGRNFVDRGGAVGLVQTGSQVRFEVNLGAAKKSDVRFSSRLIRLAARVKR